MPEPRQTNPSGRLPASPAAKPSSPLVENGQRISRPGEEKVRAALRAGNMEEIDGMGSRAKPMLFNIIQDREEDLAFRRMAADAATELYENIRLYDRILCFLLQDRVGDAAAFGKEAVDPVVGVLKNTKENPLLRSIAVEVLVSIKQDEKDNRILTVVGAFSSLLAKEQEVPTLRAKIADEIPRLAGICDAAKMRMIRSALERAANSQNSGVAFAAEEAILLLENGPNGCTDDESPTLRLSEKT